ncbi:MAG: oligosaccharide flippase family protein [Candidatus Binatus sp.]
MRTTRFLLTFLSREAYTVLTLLVALWATPLLLHWLGDERFGAFQVATDWLGYLGLLEFGLGGALAPLLAMAEGRGDERAARGLMVTGIRNYVKVTLMIVAGTILLAAIITWLIPVQPQYARDLRIAILVSLIGSLITPLSPFRALAEARQQGYWVSIFLGVQSVVITGGSLVMAWAGWGITGQAIAVVAGAAVFNLGLLYVVRSEVPAIAAAVVTAPRDDEARRDLRRLNLPTFTLQIGGRLSLMTDNIIVARFLSPSIVAAFFLTQRLAVLALAELQGIGSASWAALAELSVQGRTELFNRRLIELTRSVAVLGFAVLVPIVAYNRAFISLWVGSQRYAGDWLTILAATNALMLGIFSLWGWCISGTGGAPMLTRPLVGQAIVNVTCSIGFTLAFGLIGPVLGTTVSFLAVSAWFMPRAMAERFGTSPAQLLAAVGVPALLAIPFGALTWWFSTTYGATGWIGIAWQMSAAAGLYLALSWLIIFRRDERADLLNRFRTAVRAVAA